MCGTGEPTPVVASVSSTVAVPVGSAASVAPEIELVSTDVARTKFLRDTNQTRVTALVTFDRQAPENMSTNISVTVSGDFAQSRAVSRTAGRTQSIEFYLPGRVSNSAIDAVVTGPGVRSASSGRCDFPWQRDSAGRRCGERAASERSGGRNP